MVGGDCITAWVLHAVMRYAGEYLSPPRVYRISRKAGTNGITCQYSLLQAEDIGVRGEYDSQHIEGIPDLRYLVIVL